MSDAPLGSAYGARPRSHFRRLLRSDCLGLLIQVKAMPFKDIAGDAAGVLPHLVSPCPFPLDCRRESGESIPVARGGVLVSTWETRQRRHAEDGSWASLIIGPKINC